MLRSIIKMQIEELLQKKLTLFVYGILMMFVAFNFISNVIEFGKIRYITEMYDFSKVLILSAWRPISYYLMEYLPILVVLPTACSYLNDKLTGTAVYISSKVSTRRYLYGKIIAVFCVTFILFTLPLLLELIISCVCFDMNSFGDPSGFNYYAAIEYADEYFMSDLYMSNRIVYVLLYIIMFGMVTGILAIWNVAVSTLPIFKYKVFTFFPIYILTFLLSFAERVMKPSHTFNYFFILRMFETVSVSWLGVIIFFIILFGMSIVLIEIRIKKEVLL